MPIRIGVPDMIRRKCATLGTALLTAGALATTTHDAAAAEETCSYTSSTDRPALTYMNTGPSVKQAQCLSNVWGGVPKLAVDGVFDSATSKKIIWIQGCHGLDRTGVVEENTWQVLYHPALDCYDPYPG
ncbi:peptidoglycan-binding protein [Streptomyces sp. Ncost-T10-10d]|uniref:peptidoglycan-binding domain-containing protein n=1 Tax=Streptomyces sp. Ncost-T10-10d TaxID=1839774 RepID=UPI00081D55C0|nr:peptidoglycan-binding domain-containing protein [Streptomyces sp. Ncost-T10-10d]SCF71708.1 Putative peptidoglycan binding domain-containing protein [Streptomyces sp. Ncost-T10-10d]